MPNMRSRETALDLTSEQIHQRNELIVKYLHLIEGEAAQRDNPDETHYTKDELVSAAYEGAVIATSKHIRNGGEDGPQYVTYLKNGIRFAVLKFIEREAEMFDRGFGAEFVPLEDIEDTEWVADHNTPESIYLEEEHERQKVKLFDKLLDIIATELKPKQSVVMYLYFAKHMTQDQISSELGISQQAVGRRLNRGIVALKQQAEKNGVSLESFLG